MFSWKVGYEITVFCTRCWSQLSVRPTGTPTVGSPLLSTSPNLRLSLETSSSVRRWPNLMVSRQIAMWYWCDIVNKPSGYSSKAFTLFVSEDMNIYVNVKRNYVSFLQGRNLVYLVLLGFPLMYQCMCIHLSVIKKLKLVDMIKTKIIRASLFQFLALGAWC